MVFTESLMLTWHASHTSMRVCWDTHIQLHSESSDGEKSVQWLTVASSCCSAGRAMPRGSSFLIPWGNTHHAKCFNQS